MATLYNIKKDGIPKWGGVYDVIEDIRLNGDGGLIVSVNGVEGDLDGNVEVMRVGMPDPNKPETEKYEFANFNVFDTGGYGLRLNEEFEYNRLTYNAESQVIGRAKNYYNSTVRRQGDINNDLTKDEVYRSRYILNDVEVVNTELTFLTSIYGGDINDRKSYSLEREGGITSEIIDDLDISYDNNIWSVKKTLTISESGQNTLVINTDKTGMYYNSDVSAGFTDNHLITKKYFNDNAPEPFTIGNGLVKVGNTLKVGSYYDEGSGNYIGLLSEPFSLQHVNSNTDTGLVINPGYLSIYSSGFDNNTGVRAYLEVRTGGSVANMKFGIKSDESHNSFEGFDFNTTVAPLRFTSTKLRPLNYNEDYSANFTDYSLVNKKWVLDNAATLNTAQTFIAKKIFQTPNATTGNGISPIEVKGGNGANGTATTGFNSGGNAGDIKITSGNGGSATSSSDTNIGGKGGEIYILAGDGGFGLGGTTAFGGAGGNALLQAGNSLGSGLGGNAELKAGNSQSGTGGNVYVVAGSGHNDPLGSEFSGNIYLGISSSGISRGNIIVGGTNAGGGTGDLVPNGKKLEVRGTGSFTGTVVGADAVEDNEFVTKSQLDANKSLQAVTTGLGNNTTSNALNITGGLSTDLVKEGLNMASVVISGNKAGYISFVDELMLGSIAMTVDGFQFAGKSTTVTLKEETPTVSGMEVNSRVKGSPAISSDEFVTKSQSVRSLTVVADGSLSIFRDELNNKFPNAVKGDRYCNGRLVSDNSQDKILVEYMGNGDWWVTSGNSGTMNQGLAEDAQP